MTTAAEHVHEVAEYHRALDLSWCACGQELKHGRWREPRTSAGKLRRHAWETGRAAGVKVIIAGSRSLESRPDLNDVVYAAMRDSGLYVSAVVSGCARGVDLAGEWWAAMARVPVIHWPYISHLGRRGGYVRNAQMADYADALVALYDGQSKGTQHMVDLMRKAGKRVHLVEVGQG